MASKKFINRFWAFLDGILRVGFRGPSILKDGALSTLSNVLKVRDNSGTGPAVVDVAEADVTTAKFTAADGKSLSLSMPNGASANLALQWPISNDVYGASLKNDGTGNLTFNNNQHSTGNTGWVSGGDVTISPDNLVLAITSGSGYVPVGADIRLVTWADTFKTLLSNTISQYLFVDGSGTIQLATVEPDYSTNILLCLVDTDATKVTFFIDHRIPVSQFIPMHASYLEDVIGPVCNTGINASIHNAPSLQLETTPGSYYRIYDELEILATNPTSWFYMYKDGSGGWLQSTTTITTVDTNYYDNGSGTLAPVPPGKYKKDLLFVGKTPTGAIFRMFYGQTLFDTPQAAEVGINPLVRPEQVTHTMRVAGIVSLSGDSAITSVVDQRPFLGQSATGITQITRHGDLTGLGADDHTQYYNQTRGDLRYAAIARGVTNGDAHDHNGGDGALIAIPSRTVLSTSSLQLSDSLVLLNTAGAAFTFTLLDAATCDGRIFNLKKMNAGNPLIVATVASQTIDGDLTKTISNRFTTMTIIASGGNWNVI